MSLVQSESIFCFPGMKLKAKNARLETNARTEYKMLSQEEQ